jgi:DNA-binding response OmpR family regulator
MFGSKPYAVIVDRDEAGRACMAALLRESGFVVAAFRDRDGALSALAARSVDIVIVAGELSEGEDALAAARQMRRLSPETRVLFAGAADALPPAPGAHSGHAVTRPFDKRGFLSAVFELLARGVSAAEGREEAEFALMKARFACLRSRLTGFGGGAELRPMDETTGPGAIV